MIQSCVFTDEISRDFEEAVRLCAELRVDYVEVRGVWDTNINRMDLEGARKLKTILDRYGVSVGILGSGLGKCNLFDDEEWAENLSFFERQIRFCDLFDTRKIRCFAFWVPEGVDYRAGERPDLETHLGPIAERLQGPARRAAQEGIVLSLETEAATFGGTCPEVRAVIDAVDCSALTCCWDVANSWSAGRIAFPNDYEYIQGMVTHVHVKDCTFDPADQSKRTGWTHIDLGEIPYKEIFKTLIADGYEGLASVETHLFSDMADRFRWLTPATAAALRNLNRILAETRAGL
jgi:sugar phosphate isomerase/epimerase